MKTQSSLKIYYIAPIVAMMLYGCGSGGTNSSDTTSNSNKSGLDSQVPTTQQYTISLYNSLFLTPNVNYSYQFMDVSGNNISGNSGSFTCNTPTTCSINPTLTQQQPYLLSISKVSDNTVVGGTLLNVPINTSYFSTSIDDISTSTYLNQLISSRLNNSYDAPIVQSRLFLPALSYEPGVSLNGMLYLYYNYLTQTKSQSYSDAISTITTEYQQCEQTGLCTIDSGFMNNSDVVKAAAQNLQQTVTQYSKDKNDAQLYQTYVQIKSTVSTASTLVNAASGPLNAVVGGLGSGLVTGMGVVSQLIDPYFNAEGLQDSLAAYNRMQAYNQAISSYFIAAIPNYASIQNTLIATMNSATIATNYSYNMNSILSGYFEVVNNFASSESVTQYVASKSSTPRNLDWLVGSDGSSGVFGSTNATQRMNAITYFTTPDNIIALANAYKQSFQLDPVPNVHVNNIANRQAYNQRMLSLMQNIITALQYAMYLDQLVVTVRDTVKFPKNSYLQNMVLAAPLTLSPIGGSNFASDTSAVNAYYYNQLQAIESNFLQNLAPEKAYVSQSVLQTLEVNGKCNITGTDGQNTLTASCPVYVDGGNGNIVTKYITSTLDRTTTNCLLQTGADAGQGIMGVANVQNINGYVACEAPNSGQVASYDTTTDSFSFGNENIVNMQHYPIGVSGSYQYYKWNIHDSLNFAIGDTVGQNKIANTAFNIYSIPQDYPVDGNYEYLINYIESDQFGNITPRFLDVVYQFNPFGSSSTGGNGVTYYYLKFHEHATANENYIFANSSIPQQQIAAPLQMSMQIPYANVLLINNPIMSQLPLTLPSILTFAESNNISITIPNSANLTSIQSRSLFGGTNNALYVAFSDNGKNFSRVLLPGGQYDVVESTGTIVMSNSDRWETDSTINPFISSAASPLVGRVHISGTTGDNHDLNCPNSSNVDQMAAGLIAQGRDEVANKIHEMNCSQDNSYNIAVTLPKTSLYIPFQVNYSGYKSFTVWNSQNGYRADRYGDSTSNDLNNDHCPYVDTYNISGSTYDGGHITTGNNGYWQSFCWSTNSLDLRGWK